MSDADKYQSPKTEAGTVQVRPHPHIGLSTVSYLFEGEIIHRDSLGYVQPIQARQDWRENRFTPVPGETGFIPLPDA